MKKNIIANVIGKIWGVFSNFIFVPIYINILGFESFSIISFTLILSSVIAIMDGGLSATLSREFARSDIRSESKIKTYETLQIIYFGLVFLSIVTMFLFSEYISRRIKVENFSLNEISTFIKIVSFDLAFQLIFRFYFGGILGYSKQILANIVQIGWGIFRNAFLILILYFYPTLKIYFIWQAVVTILFAFLIKYILDTIVYQKRTFNLALRFDFLSFKLVKNFTGGILLISLISVITSQLDKILISQMVSIENLGYYTLAVALSTSLFVLVSPIATAILPKFTTLFSLKDLVSTRKLFNSYNLCVSIIVFSFLSNIVFFAKELIWLWTGDMNLVEKSSVYVPIIALAYGFMVLQSISYQVALSNGYTKLNNIIGVVSVILIVPGYIYLGKFYGGIGIAYCFLAIQLLSFIFFVYFINLKFIGERFFTKIFYQQYFVPAFFSFLIAFSFSFYNPFIFELKLYTFLWIGLSTAITFLIVVFCSVPIKQIKLLLKLKII